jgi:hypothetical protein
MILCHDVEQVNIKHPDVQMTFISRRFKRCTCTIWNHANHASYMAATHLPSDTAAMDDPAPACMYGQGLDQPAGGRTSRLLLLSGASE